MWIGYKQFLHCNIQVMLQVWYFLGALCCMVRDLIYVFSEAGYSNTYCSHRPIQQLNRVVITASGAIGCG